MMAILKTITAFANDLDNWGGRIPFFPINNTTRITTWIGTLIATLVVIRVLQRQEEGTRLRQELRSKFLCIVISIVNKALHFTHNIVQVFKVTIVHLRNILFCHSIRGKFKIIITKVLNMFSIC